MVKRVAIIGSGPSGLSQMRAFKAAEEKGEEIPEVVCFEKQADWGGLWNYDWRTGTDAVGEPLHASMYRDLWSNGPKECLELADYPFDAHFGKPIASYPPRPVLADYIKGRAAKSGIRPWIRFDSPVRMVAEGPPGKFTVTAHDRARDVVYSEEFDHVVVATGHFSTPNVPEGFQGLEKFRGRVLHAHEVREFAEFRDQEVLVVGCSFSAEDVASQCYKFGAKSITISFRSHPTGYKWPENMKEVPLLERVSNGRTCHFKDGSQQDYDAIILCTGYLHNFPFMADGLRLQTTNRFWPMGLYEGVVWEANPNLFYLGMQDQFYTFFMFDAQAWLVRDIIMGRRALPSREEMEAHSRQWKAKEEGVYASQDVRQLVWFQADYIKELVAQTDYPLQPEAVEGTKQYVVEWKRHKDEDIMGFRDQVFRSAVTGTVGRKLHTPWLAAFDDSLETYVR